jgi:hypothetical protein
MAGRKLRAAVIAELQARAAALGDDVSALDFVVEYLSSGNTIAQLARSLAPAVIVSRPTVSEIIRRLEPDAGERVAAAQRESAAAMIDDTIDIADATEPTAGAVAAARVQITTRQWNAERFDPGKFKGTPTVQVNVGNLMLDALRQPAPARPATAPEEESR